MCWLLLLFRENGRFHRFYLFIIFLGLPVLMTQFCILMFCVPVTWIPSVLGLFPGAITARFKASTFWHSWNIRCICCAFLILRLDTLKFLHWWKVTAYKQNFKEIREKSKWEKLAFMFIYEVRQALENGEVHINLQLVHACKAAKQWKRKIMNN